MSDGPKETTKKYRQLVCPGFNQPSDATLAMDICCNISSSLKIPLCGSKREIASLEKRRNLLKTGVWYRPFFMLRCDRISGHADLLTTTIAIALESCHLATGIADH